MPRFDCREYKAIASFGPELKVVEINSDEADINERVSKRPNSGAAVEIMTRLKRQQFKQAKSEFPLMPGRGTAIRLFRGRTFASDGIVKNECLAKSVVGKPHRA
ncbi:MAG: hypothetical protein LBQ12_04560 [Deltaproteobacteria bacterium]|jgi:uncharacterized protein YggU (UPF0235/DUF167 family)|nr:hypothetical protein [Deltaproteobacteria bacterium]